MTTLEQRLSKAIAKVNHYVLRVSEQRKNLRIVYSKFDEIVEGNNDHLNDETFENWTGHVVISEAEEELNIYIQKLKKARYDLALLDETYGKRNRLWYGMWTTFDEIVEMCDFYKCTPNGKDTDTFLRNKIKAINCNYVNAFRGWNPYANMIKYLNNSSLLKDLGLAGTIPVPVFM